MKSLKCISLCFILLFTFFGCSKEADPCEGVSCLNGGTCFNGGCDCPDMWTGLDCATPQTPSRVILDLVAVRGFPEKNGTQDWDANSTPDIYIKVEKVAGGLLHESGFYENAEFNKDYSFEMQGVFLEPSEIYAIYLYDQDLLADDLMGRLLFISFDAVTEFPESVLIEDSGITMEVFLRYEF